MTAGETIVTAYAEPAAGPGWSNSPIWIIVRTESGALRVDCLQPEDQTSEMRALFGVSAAATAAMVRAVLAARRPHRKAGRVA